MKINMLGVAKTLLLSSFALLTVSCSDDDSNQEQNSKQVFPYYIGLQADKDTDVLVGTKSLTSGEITAVKTGIAQPGWMFYFSSGNKIYVADYNANKQITAYDTKSGKLAKGKSLTTDLQVFSQAVIDDNTMVLVGSEFQGFNQKEIYIVDTEAMAITKKAKITLESDQKNNIGSMPTDIALHGNKLLVSFHNILGSNPQAVPLPAANVAKIAVFNYPELTFDKMITDTRCPNLGRYASTTVLEKDENGDIYTYATSSVLSGFAPIPATNSGVLRIKKGTTEFDKDFHIDFEKISGGLKINDLFYVANGKAVVRAVKEDETLMAKDLEALKTYAWGAYSPKIATPMCVTGILDLNAGTFKALDIPLSGGTFNSPVLVEGTKLYLGVSSATFADIYEIDVTTDTAKKGATVKGDYAKAILKVTK